MKLKKEKPGDESYREKGKFVEMCVWNIFCMLLFEGKYKRCERDTVRFAQFSGESERTR